MSCLNICWFHAQPHSRNFAAQIVVGVLCCNKLALSSEYLGYYLESGILKNSTKLITTDQLNSNDLSYCLSYSFMWFLLQIPLSSSTPNWRSVVHSQGGSRRPSPSSPLQGACVLAPASHCDIQKI